MLQLNKFNTEIIDLIQVNVVLLEQNKKYKVKKKVD